MARKVTINQDFTALPNGFTYMNGQSVVLTDEQFNLLRPNVFTSGKLTDNGVQGVAGQQVTTQAGTVAAPVALTSAVAAASPPVKTEYDALRTDVVNLRTTVAALITALRVSNGPMA